MCVLKAVDIHKSFGDNQVLQGISFQVNQGEVLSVIGPSGSGKSTLLRCSTLLETVDAGSVVYGDLTMCENGAAGKAVYAPPAVLQQIRRRFGLVFQNFNLFPHFSVLRNLTEAPVRVLGREKIQAREEAMALLRKVGLSDKADAYPCELSGGQQQRVAIALSLIHIYLSFSENDDSFAALKAVLEEMCIRDRLYILAFYIAHKLGHIDDRSLRRLLSALIRLPDMVCLLYTSTLSTSKPLMIIFSQSSSTGTSTST